MASKTTFFGLRHLLIVAFILTFFSFSYASHVAGGEISYECIGPNQYRVTLVVYRDCNGIDLGTTETISYRSAACGVNSSLGLTQQSVTDITPLCPTAPSACGGGSGPIGIERVVYTGILNLPPGCTDWILSYQMCCRNNAITNVSSASSNDFYVQTTLNNTVTPCNSSPTFASNPQLFACVGQTINFQQLATDADGDVLVYSLVNAMNGSGSNVTYAGGFSGANPFTVPAVIDPVTGQLTFTPNTTQVAVVAVLVQEYRNGVLIGSVMRDIQFNIVNCTNVIPTISGIDGVPGDFEITACVGAPLCFDINSTESDAGQNITMSFSNNIPGATFTQSGSGNAVSGTFCWNTTIDDIGTHVISVTVEDDACPLIGQNSQTYTINIVANPNPPVNAGPDVTICAGETATISASSGAAPALISGYSWTPTTTLADPNNLTTTATPSSTTSYTINMTYTDGCSSSDAVSVIISDDPIASVFPQTADVCGGASFVLTGSTDQTGMTFQWFDPSMTSLGSGVVSGTSSSLVVSVPGANGSYTYTLRITNPLTGCISEATSILTVGTPPALPSCVNIYVSTTGLISNAGTQAAPTTLAEALSRAACNNAVIKIATGTYNIDNALTIGSFVTLEGGFIQGSAWTKTSTPGATTINRTVLNPEGVANAQRIVAFYGNGATGFRFQDITITTANANLPGMSTYGIHMNGCSNYEFVRTQVLPGAGAAGAGDDNPATYNSIWDGANGGNGVNGTTGGGPECTCNLGTDDGGSGGNGGSAGVGGANATVIGGVAGSGAAGGRGGDGRPDNTSAAGIAGTAGSAAVAGGSGGAGGAGGNQDGNGNSTSNVGNGAAGNTGTAGTNGITNPSSHVAGFWVPGTGTNGTAATGGGGGGGGGGTGRDTDNCDAAGGGGSGGGGGGGGGGAGRGAFGGGSSFGIYLLNNGANGNLIQDLIVAGAAGAGGLGGRGGNGGNGGASAIGNGCTNGDSDGNRGGTGGAGGTGGNGGAGGNGPNGVSISIYLASGAALVTNVSNFNLAAQPVIQVSNINCTNTNVQFQDMSSSGTTWDYDATTNFATPATGVANPSSTMYSSIDRYTVGLGANTYVGFHNIAFANTILPNILTNATVVATDTFSICQGDFANFQSEYFADTYTWNFNGAIPNPGNVQVVNSQFNTPGFYPISMSMTTDCCGTTPDDVIYLYVIPVSAATGSGNESICEDENAVLTITGLNPTDSVVWTPSIGVLTNTPATLTVSPAVTTTYTATVYSSVSNGTTSVIGCPITLNFTVTVNNLPDLNLSSTPVVCSLDGTATATPSSPGSFNFQWSTGTTHLNAPNSTITGLTGGIYTVTMTDPLSGCFTSDDIMIGNSPTAPVAYIQSLNEPCSGLTNGSVTVATAGGTSPYSYVWNGGAPISSATTITQTGLTGGSYTVVVTDALGCVSNLLVELPELPIPAYQVLNNGPVCSGEDVIFSVSGSDGAEMIYDIGAGSVSIVLDHLPQDIVISGATVNQTLTVLSIIGYCSVNVNTSSTVVVNPEPTVTVLDDICSGTDYTYPDGTTHTNITADETYVSMLTTLAGCDSIVTTQLTVNPIYSLTETVNACENSTVTYPDGSTATITGNTSYTSNLLTLAGCDSVIVTTVIMDPIYNVSENIFACENSTVTYPDGSTATITSNTSYTSNLLSLAGCDSTVVTNVTMNPIYAFTEDIVACENSTVTYPDGTTATITSSGSYTSNLTSISGCDSTIVTNVTMTPIVTTVIDEAICSGTDYTFPDGTIHTAITVNESYTSTLVSVLTGCDSLVVTNIDVIALPTATIDGGASYCTGDVLNDVFVAVTGTANWTIDYELDGTALTATGSTSPIVLNNVVGTYVIIGITDGSCSNTASGTETIIVNPIPAAPSAGYDTTYCSLWTLVPMTATGELGATFNWYDALGNALGTGSSFTPINEVGVVNYYVTQSVLGCEGPSTLVEITIKECEITIPTAFTPDGDGVNEDWQILELDALYPDNKVQIYNRWGNMIFEHNSSTDGSYDSNRWNGDYNGNPLPVGSYYFIIELNDTEDARTGIVSIIKN